MSIPGHTDYTRREYCKDIECAVQGLLDKQDPDSPEYKEIQGICKSDCIHSTYEFHHWLIEHGYLVVRPDA